MRRWHLAVLALLGVFALACEEGTGAADPKPTGSPKSYPSSMAALGDSITAGFASCFALVACERRSWATGSDSAVDSHYRRIRDSNAAIKGKAYNFAEPGADSADLAAQARKAVNTKVQYVTILIGSNDACAPSTRGMTPVATFRQRVDSGLARLKKGLPKTRVLMVSIPDLYRLWEVGHSDEKAVRAWGRGICPSLLARPTSTAEADEDRRRQVDRRIDAYNDALADACRAYGKKCRWDSGEVHNVRFDLELVNRIDYFHPSTEGQARLAEVSYPGRFTW
ncbi:SGNH/GDSL hydrolase family protein [Paractinoplanes atraurantiacus]|uniref:Lysophospholipase L1 n=1 Tax=Paractinoplanes atraurantiacus TaxID=1036182 RepID=A0A285JWT0_9ACTN|nr:SGNH/GDSL hydrolase family protein [Actinoplanes atraurantiacus]SNY64772.1 Lysophospholipase L1 [Actinoplanes atraurantiacus]